MPPAPTTVQWAGATATVLSAWSQFCNGDRGDRDDHPINCVDWNTASNYCEWAGGALPTEAQWEYAARGSSGRKYPWGNAPAPGPKLLNACGGECRAMGKKIFSADWKVMYEEDDGASETAPVKRYPMGATPEGVYDLAGNVWEWVQDMKADYDPSMSKDPVQTKGVQRVLRGGGWFDYDPRWVRAADRFGLGAGVRDHNVGFRCARGSEQ
ncbi:MAG: formylglycine-generating enzyme family protein [Polyangiaceae bacterium]